MFALEMRRFVGLVLGALTVSNGGCGCDDDKQSGPFGPDTPCVTTFDELRPKLFFPCWSALPGNMSAATFCVRNTDWETYVIVKRCADGFEVNFSDMEGSSRCFYDIESKRLIGIENATDIQGYCDGTSSTLVAGTVFDCSADAEKMLGVYCSDPYTKVEGGSGGTSGSGGSEGMDAGRLDGSNGNVNHDDSGSDDDSGS